MSPRQKFYTRAAQSSDVNQLVEVEKKSIIKSGLEPFTAEHFKIWLNTNPDFFLVAEPEGGGPIVGYTYNQAINFSFEDVKKIKSADVITDNGFTKKTHISKGGNAIYGVNLAATREGKGAGTVLDNKVRELIKTYGFTYYVGASRISNLNTYVKILERSAMFAEITKELEWEIAIWYTLECARLVGAKVLRGSYPSLKLPLNLPQLEKPDQVLGWHLRDQGFNLVTLKQDYMHDPESRGYAVLVVKKLSK